MQINSKCHKLSEPLCELICDWQEFQLLFWPKVLWHNPAQHSCQERTATNLVRIAGFWHSWASRREEEHNCCGKGRKLKKLHLPLRGPKDGLTLLRDPHVETKPAVWEKIYLLDKWLMPWADSGFSHMPSNTPVIACAHLFKLVTLLSLVQISAYMPLLEGQMSHNACPVSGQIILGNLQGNLDKKMLQCLIYQEYHAEGTLCPAKEGNLCCNNQHQHRENQWFFSVTWSQPFLCKEKNNSYSSSYKSYTVSQDAFPCKASGTRTKSFAQCLASWVDEQVESCVQQVIILMNVQPTCLWQNWFNVTVMSETTDGTKYSSLWLPTLMLKNVLNSWTQLFL